MSIRVSPRNCGGKTIADAIASHDYNYFITISPKIIAHDGQKIRPSRNEMPILSRYVSVISNRIANFSENILDKNGIVYEGLRFIAIPELYDGNGNRTHLHFHALCHVNREFEPEIVHHIINKSPELSQKILGFRTYVNIGPINNIIVTARYVTKNFYKHGNDLDFFYRDPCARNREGSWHSRTSIAIQSTNDFKA